MKKIKKENLLYYWLHEYIKYTFFGSDSDELDSLNHYEILARTYLLSQVVRAMYQVKPVDLTAELIRLKHGWTRLLRECEVNRCALQEFIRTMNELIAVSKEHYQHWKTLS